MKAYTFSEARQNFSSILNMAQIEGAVCINRKDGQSFILQPSSVPEPPLDLKGIDCQYHT